MIEIPKYTQKERLLVSLFALLIFAFFTYITSTMNIHGDAKYHALSAKESVQQEALVQYQPYRIFNFSNNKRIYMPIAYPLTAESLFTILYLFGGEVFLKLYAPLFATGIFLIGYFCVRELGIIQAAVASAFGVIAIGERLLMTPLMEPYFVLSLLTACLLLKKYYFSKKNSTLFLAAGFLGTAACIKQQGLILATFIVGFVITYLVYLLIKKEFSVLNLFKILIPFLVIFILVPSAALVNQIQRTGTLAYAPGGTSLNSALPFSQYIQPALTSKFPSNPAATKAISQIIGYNKIKVNLTNKFKGFLMSPFLYFRSTDVNYYASYQIMFVNFVATLIVLCLVSKDKIVVKNKFILVLFICLTGIEAITSYLFRTPITQYHSFGILIMTMLLFFFAFRFIIITKYLQALMLILFVTFFIIGYCNYIYPLWGQSGRETDTQLEGYKRIAQYVQQKTSQQAIFLAAETSFRYYAQRDFIWLNESLGDSVSQSVSTSCDRIAIGVLNKMKINYVVINREQIQRNGVNDYLPPNGMVSYIGHSRYFTKVYDAFGDDQMTVYKVNKIQ